MTLETNARRGGSGQTIRLLHGDSFEVIEALSVGEVVAVVTDPPYG